jgi:hypothetical protein
MPYKSNEVYRFCVLTIADFPIDAEAAINAGMKRVIITLMNGKRNFYFLS